MSRFLRSSFQLFHRVSGTGCFEASGIEFASSTFVYFVFLLVGLGFWSRVTVSNSLCENLAGRNFVHSLRICYCSRIQGVEGGGSELWGMQMK